VGVSAADEERGLSAALAGLGKKSAGHEAEGINQARTQGQIERAQNCSGGARLRFRRGRAGGGDYDGLAHPCRLEDDVALDGGEAAGVEIGSLELAEGFCGDDEEAAGGAGGYLKAAVGTGDGRCNYLPVADEHHGSTGNFGAGGVRDYASD